MDSLGDGLVDPTSSFVPAEAMELFQRIGSIVVALGVALFLFLLLRKFVFFLTWRRFRDGPYVIGYHQWRPGNLAGPHWCNICESIVYGIRSYVVTCDICGMFAHAQCAAATARLRAAGSSAPASLHASPSASPNASGASTADHATGSDGLATRRVACKEAATAPPLPSPVASPPVSNDPAPLTLALPAPRQQHLWIKGNIDPMDTCSICGLFCGSILALSGLKCAWCHMRVHEKCFQTYRRRPHHHHHHHQRPYHMLKHCDFGRHANLILPPSAVTLKDAAAPSSLSSKSQRALSSVRSAAQLAVNKMSNIRLRRSVATPPTTPPVAIDMKPPADGASTSSTAPSSPCVSPQQSLAPLADAPFLPIRLESSDTAGTSSAPSSAPPSPQIRAISGDDALLPPLLPSVTPPASTDKASTLASSVELLPFEIVPPKDTTPLLVFINSRSGGQLGLHVLRQIRRWLNPIQIYDLSHQTPIAPLLQFKDIPRLRILVCGGDGTVGWVLGALDEIGAPRQPPIAILPLGTGNDLARVLGWGSGYSTKDVSDLLAEVEAAHVSLLDRWRVEIDGKKRAVCNNYLGVGVDAQVALEFHEQRERSPGLFMSQFVNKLWYSQFGAKNFLVRTCAGLPSKITLECDGKVITLPDGTEGVILLNINSYGGGSTLWHEDSDSDSDDEDDNSETDDDAEDDATETDDGSLSDGEVVPPRLRLGPSSPHDGMLDVVAVYGTLHLGQMQVGLSKAVRLCQAKHVKIRLLERLPIQIDGEPWQQDPCDVDISFHQQAFMLSRTVQERDFVTRKVGEVLDWAENTGVIASSQRDVLLAEIARRVADSNDGAALGLGGPPAGVVAAAQLSAARRVVAARRRHLPRPYAALSSSGASTSSSSTHPPPPSPALRRRPRRQDSAASTSSETN
ncbi:hypothetical protein ATCC90586_006932 [Pythium insidiosum]|nr:hypothetical protein ATCC90586_006932 [Pythium insidiosum]